MKPLMKDIKWCVEDILTKMSKLEKVSLTKPKEVPDQLLQELFVLLDNDTLKGLHLVDAGDIQLLTDAGGFKIFRVPSATSRSFYYVLHRTFFCTCVYFRNQISLQSKGIICKHIIAARVAEALERVDHRVGDQEEISRVLTSMRDFVAFTGPNIKQELSCNPQEIRVCNWVSDPATHGIFQGPTSSKSLNFSEAVVISQVDTEQN